MLPPCPSTFQISYREPGTKSAPLILPALYPQHLLPGNDSRDLVSCPTLPLLLPDLLPGTGIWFRPPSSQTCYQEPGWGYIRRGSPVAHTGSRHGGRRGGSFEFFAISNQKVMNCSLAPLDVAKTYRAHRSAPAQYCSLLNCNLRLLFSIFAGTGR